jgi:hypothetical protein
MRPTADQDRLLHIFISHKMPEDTPLAAAIGERLGVYAKDKAVRIQPALPHRAVSKAGAMSRNLLN